MEKGLAHQRSERSVLSNPLLAIARSVGVHCKKTETDDRIIWNFCCIKTKKKKEIAHAQKQECGCPSLQPSLRSHTHAFLADPPR